MKKNFAKIGILFVAIFIASASTFALNVSHVSAAKGGPVLTDLKRYTGTVTSIEKGLVIISNKKLDPASKGSHRLTFINTTYTLDLSSATIKRTNPTPAEIAGKPIDIGDITVINVGDWLNVLGTVDGLGGMTGVAVLLTEKRAMSIDHPIVIKK